MYKQKLFILFSIVLLSTTACININTGGKADTSGIDGGVFRSDNKGALWAQRNAVPTASGKALSLSGTNYSLLAIDPGDHRALYYGAVANGLYYTYDSANTWQKASGLGNITVRAIGIDAQDKCNIFVGTGNKLFRSIDCSRSWQQVYVDSEAQALVDTVAVDYFNGNNIYISVVRGDLIKSSDQGKSWQTIYRFNKRVTKLFLDPNDSRRMFAVVDGKEIQQSRDGGANWSKFDVVLKELKLEAGIQEFLLFKGRPELMFIATQKGIVRSNDSGTTWTQIELIPPEKNAAVEALAVNPLDEKEIYYIAGNTFYRSVDSGVNWTPGKIATTRIGKKIIIDPVDPRIIYLGVWKVPEK